MVSFFVAVADTYLIAVFYLFITDLLFCHILHPPTSPIPHPYDLDPLLIHLMV